MRCALEGGESLDELAREGLNEVIFELRPEESEEANYVDM